MSEFLETIGSIIGDERVLTDGQSMQPYLEERRGRYESNALAVVRPGSTEEVAKVVHVCQRENISIVPQSGNTGLCGGAVATRGQIILSLDRMNNIRSIDTDNYTITAEAGCILTNIQQAAKEVNRYFPLSLSAEGSCQIGGNLATNAGGLNVLRYGNARDLTLGLEAVLPDGSIWNGLNALRKNNTGYDLKNLLVGSEGTLGIITAAVLKLFPYPVESHTAFIGFNDLEKCPELLSRCREASGDQMSSFELIAQTCLDFAFKHISDTRDPFSETYKWYVLVEFSGTRQVSGLREAMEQVLHQSLEDNLIQDATINENETQAQAFWFLREAIIEGQKFEGASLKHDVSVQIPDVPAFIHQATAKVLERLPGLRVCAFGHAGDGNIHLNLSQPVDMDGQAYLAMQAEINDIVNSVVSKLHGSFSAEHGVGIMRLNDMRRYKDEVELAMMRTIKQSFDPNNIMNPGKVLP